MRVVSDNSSDPRQWVIYGTIKQYLPDSQTIYAWNLQDTPLVTLSDGYLSSITTGPTLDRLMRNNANPTSPIYFVDGGKRYRIPWPDMLSAWNFDSRVISGVPPGMYDGLTDAGDLSYAVKDQTGSAIYMMDGANGGGQTAIRQYQDASVFHAWEGDNTGYTTLATSSGFFDSINDAIGSTITTPKVSYNGAEYEIANGTRTQNSTAVSSLYPGSAQAISAMTFKRLPSAGNSTYIVQSVNDSAVYLIDAGVKHHVFANTLRAWGGATTPRTYVNNAFLNTFTTGADLTGYLADVGGQLYLMDDAKITVPTGLDTAYRASGTVLNVSASLGSLLPMSPRVVTGYIIASDSSPVYVLNNTGQKQHMEWPDKVSAWGGYQTGLTVLSPYVVASVTTGASPATYVSDGTNEYYLDNGQKWILPSGVKATWGITATPQLYTDGTLSRIPTAGTLTDKIRDSVGGYYYIRNGAADVTFDPNIADVWGLTGGTLMSPAFVRSNFPQYMLTRFVQSSVPGNSQKFIIDRGNWYSISDAQFANLGGPGSPMMQLNPSLAPNTITAWTYVVVKAGDGSYFVIDGGGKHYFNSNVIRDYWTSNGTITAPLVTNGFVIFYRLEVLSNVLSREVAQRSIREKVVQNVVFCLPQHSISTMLHTNPSLMNC